MASRCNRDYSCCFEVLGSLGQDAGLELFLALAENIVKNLCYSASTASSGLCEPTWAQQPPGYPLFIAFTQSLAGTGDRVIIVSQTIVFALAALYFARWLFAWHRNNVLFHLSLATALFSPIMIGWSRAIFTELLSAASILWVMTELLRSILDGKPRPITIAAAVCAGILMRWDQICLLAPVTVALACTFGWRASLRPLIVMTSICAIPFLALMLRANFVGLPLLPSPIAGELKMPRGVIAFYRAASLDERATNLLWSLIGRRYQDIIYEPDDMYSARVNSVELRRLLVELNKLPVGSAVPRGLDDQFGRIAGRLSESWLSTQIAVPMIRSGRIWSRWLGHPVSFSSLGEKGPIRVLLIVYSLAVLVGVVAGTIVSKGALRILSIAALSLLICRTAFLVAIPISALEMRYLDPLFPSLDYRTLRNLAVREAAPICSVMSHWME